MTNKFIPLAIVLLVIAILSGCKSSQLASAVNNSEKKKSSKYSFDFVPATKVIWQEDFQKSKEGNLPADWKTNATASVVTIPETDKKGIALTKDGVYFPSAAVGLTTDFTLEFDLYCTKGFSFYSPSFQMLFASLPNKKDYVQLKAYNPHQLDLVKLWLHPNNAAENAGHSGYESIRKGLVKTSNEINDKQFFAHTKTDHVKLSVWRTGERLRVYFDEEKIWDISEAFATGINYNSLVFALSGIRDEGDQYFANNFRLAKNHD
jgi:OmpA-OmpF porin, OOP family